jgi:hypothetical protein
MRKNEVETRALFRSFSYVLGAKRGYLRFPLPSILALQRDENASEPFGVLSRLAAAWVGQPNRGLNRGRLF